MPEPERRAGRPSKRWLFLLELLHAFPSTFFLYGEPFYARRQFGWSYGQIGLSQALSGLCIAVSSALGGQIAHRVGPRTAMGMGLAGSLIGVLIGAAGLAGGGIGGFLLAFVVVSFSQAVAWPGVEAALMGGEPPARVQNFVGYFNLTWSLGTATAFLLATPLMARLGLRALFLVPAVFYAVNLLVLRFVVPRYDTALVFAEAGDLQEGAEPGALAGGAESNAPESEAALDSDVRALTASQRAAFRWLGWIANPFAYLAILVIVTYNPATQERLDLPFASASVWFSLWFYVRTLAFELLRRWTWWHYRWPFLCLTFGVTMASFAAITLAPNVATLLIAQVAFGLSVGLIYQSSLFYSMAGSETQGAHGGFHESFIGIGTMLGPLVTYGGALLLPTRPDFPIWLVLALMTVGLGTLAAIGRRTA